VFSLCHFPFYLTRIARQHSIRCRSGAKPTFDYARSAGFTVTELLAGNCLIAFLQDRSSISLPFRIHNPGLVTDRSQVLDKPQ
jgi:hypothetical protein